MQQIEGPNGTWEYEYDALGQRAAVVHDGQRVEYLVDPFALGAIADELDGSGKLVARYLHGLGLVSRIDSSGSALYYDFDGLGTTCGLADASGKEINHYLYCPFGESLQSLGTAPNPFKFLGRFGVMDDGQGLLFCRARFYHPTLGRFTAEDPVGLSGESLNLYSYVGNSPLDHLDVSGYDATPPLATTLCVQEVLWMGKPVTEWNIAQTHPWYQCVLQHENKHQSQCRTGEWPSTLESCNQIEVEVYSEEEACLEDLIASGHKALRGRLRQVRKLKSLAIKNQLPACLEDFPVPPPQRPQPPGQQSAMYVVAAVDPNQQISPSGFGPAGFIRPDTILPYRINFENDPSATAPAQLVVVTDQLNTNLDWSTFEVTESALDDSWFFRHRTAGISRPTSC